MITPLILVPEPPTATKYNQILSGLLYIGESKIRQELSFQTRIIQIYFYTKQWLVFLGKLQFKNTDLFIKNFNTIYDSVYVIL
ncbi:hypothetical protein SSCH_1230003 [Syntrophaceticus schinkii]|uniref:Uncharacterized protein n=1 Tax=Syntrophaceticus schinkii TaxID=499207 RepID=A0A0B7MCI7_9FIRM|nr:hypothetical protein SSCH_1230003 [Syntrophaceticus schinkii]